MSDLDRLEALRAAAEWGTWHVAEGSQVHARAFEDEVATFVADCLHPDDPFDRKATPNAELIVAAVNALPDLIARVRDAEAKNEQLHSWDGLMALLDEHWPTDIFPTEADRDDRDPGPRIVSLVRRVRELEGREAKLRDRTKVWREEYEAALNLDTLHEAHVWEECINDIAAILDSKGGPT